MNGGGAVGHKYSIPGSNVSFQPDNQPLGRSAVFVDQCVSYLCVGGWRMQVLRRALRWF